MARIRFRDVEFSPERAAIIATAIRIIHQYKGQRLSARQIYYRFIGDDLIPNSWVDDTYNAKHGLPAGAKNTVKNYERMASALVDARYAGLIDWDAIEDRNREPKKTRDWENGRAALDEATERFRLDRWLDQPFYVEVWVEKAALAGVLGPICKDYHVTLMVNRGYSSASAMKEAADRISRHCEPSKHSPGKRPVLLYVGDHDPSGEDMVRDIKARLLEFRCPEWLDVRKVALTWEQIEAHKLPTNPVKLNDARAQAYIEKFGHFSWEVDALPPDVLNLLMRTTVNAYIDKSRMEAIITKENIIKAKIKTFSATFVE